MNRLQSIIIGFVLGTVIYYSVIPRYEPRREIKYVIRYKIVLVPKQYTVTHVDLTCYQPVVSQCDKEPLTTSDGSRINLKKLRNGNIKWCAVSQDLLYLFPKDKPKRIYIDGFGLYEVKDVMNKRHKHKVDLLIHPKNSMRIKIEHVKIKIL